MKKQKTAIYLKLGILLFSIFAFVIACQKDDNLNKDEQNTNNKAPVIKTISYQQATETFNQLKNDLKIEKYLKSVQTNGLSKTTTDTMGVTVYTDIIKEVTLGNYKSYTMRMVIPEADSTKFHNFTIEEKNGQSNMFVTEYTPTKQWLDNQRQTYQGGIKIQHKPAGDDSGGVGGSTGGSNPNLGVGVGGVGGNYRTDYPYNCIGTVVATTEYVPYMCGCGHWPTDSCSSCSSPPYYPGYDQVIHYTCEENYDTGTDPNEGNPNTGGGGGSSTGIGNDNNLNNTSITVVVGPDEDCELPEEDKPFDLDEDCSLSPEEICSKNGNSQEVCDCVADGGALLECVEEIVLEKMTNGMDKDCQALAIFRSITKINSPFTNKIKEYFILSDANNVNLQDLSTGETASNDADFEPPMSSNVGARVLPALSENGAVILQFHNTHLDTATTLGLVNTFYHELVHAYVLRLYHTGELLNEYPSFTDLKTAMDNFFNDYDNESLANIYTEKMHDIYVDFIDDIAESIVAYCNYNNINEVSLEYAKKLVWGGLNGNDIFTNNLTTIEQYEAQTLLAYENFNDADNAKGNKTCD